MVQNLRRGIRRGSARRSNVCGMCPERGLLLAAVPAIVAALTHPPATAKPAASIEDVPICPVDILGTAAGVWIQAGTAAWVRMQVGTVVWVQTQGGTAAQLGQPRHC